MVINKYLSKSQKRKSNCFRINNTYCFVKILVCENCFQFFSLNYSVPFGEESFFSIQTSSNGILILGAPNYLTDNSLYNPYPNGFVTGSNIQRTAILAPFWDDFHPSLNNIGRVYYQVSVRLDFMINFFIGR